LSAGSAQAVEYTVSSAADLIAKVRVVNPGDIITLNPGTYNFSAPLSITRAGTSTARITLRARNRGDALLLFNKNNYTEFLSVSAANWNFQNLVIEGRCGTTDDFCDHAYHLWGAAHGTVIENNILREFNAAIKSNGFTVGSTRVFPNDVQIRNNAIYNSRTRNTSHPIDTIDVVGGKRWIIRANYIADFGQTDRVSYGAYLKGNSTDGVIERNLVVCSRNHTGGARIGLSLGDGGTGPSYCEGYPSQTTTCNVEHTNGIIRNNIIMNCSDAGIYLNEARNSKVFNNVVYNKNYNYPNSIEVRFATSTGVLVYNNITSGVIANRDGGTHSAANNLTRVARMTFYNYFLNPDVADYTLKNGTDIVGKGKTSTVSNDLCGYSRDSTLDIGPIEYISGRDCHLKTRSLYSAY
jgi:parallel beta-helix repeat protein